jgi:hypothetical protein
MVFVLGLEIGCLTPLSIIFQLYHGVNLFMLACGLAAES